MASTSMSALRRSLMCLAAGAPDPIRNIRLRAPPVAVMLTLVAAVVAAVVEASRAFKMVRLLQEQLA